MSRRYRKAAEVYGEVLGFIESYTAEHGQPPELSDVLRVMSLERSKWNYYFAAVKRTDPKAKARLYAALGRPCKDDDTGIAPPQHFHEMPQAEASEEEDEEDGGQEEDEVEEPAEEEAITPARALNEVVLWLAELTQKERIRVISGAAAFYDIKGVFALTEAFEGT